jgi:ABC-2 type transport system ATP-binding protein
MTGGMKDFRDHLKELAELEGTSILFATHLLREVEDLRRDQARLSVHLK